MIPASSPAPEPTDNPVVAEIKTLRTAEPEHVEFICAALKAASRQGAENYKILTASGLHSDAAAEIVGDQMTSFNIHLFDLDQSVDEDTLAGPATAEAEA